MAIEFEPRVPTRLQALVFHAKVRLLRVRRGMINAAQPMPRLERVGEVDHGTVISASTTPLWSETDPAEQKLQLGKVQNLRLTCRAIDGVYLAAGDTFSFWRQVGNPTRLRGFVPGRQIQEGCVIPAIGGGICQLSNALYSCALDSGCEIVERHPHTRALSRTSPFKSRDATVAWNHIDLRFRSDVGIRMSAKLTRDSLVVEFLGEKRAQCIRKQVREPRVIQDAASCETCGQGDCFRHGAVDRAAVRQSTAYVLNQTWPEFAAYLSENRHQDARCLLHFERAAAAHSLVGRRKD